MKKAFPILMVLAMLTVRAALAEEPSWRVVESVIARVDEDVITLSDLRAELICEARENPALARTPESAAREIIRRKLLVTQARKLKMEVSPEEVQGETGELAAMGRGPDEFWKSLGAFGVGRAEIARRTEEAALARSYMTLKRRSTYIPETEVRAYYRDNVEEYRDMALSDVRDEIREKLAERKFEAELNSWIGTQMKLGRVRYKSIPSEAAAR